MYSGKSALVKSFLIVSLEYIEISFEHFLWSSGIFLKSGDGYDLGNASFSLLATDTHKLM